MRSKLTKFAQVATFGFALAFTFGCSNDKDENEINLGEGELVSSSSSVVVQDCSGFVDGSKSSHFGKSKPLFCDSRDGQKYPYVNIGTQTWMAQNLNYKASGTKCYDDENRGCKATGRLYDWETAMNSCPSGWHLPTTAEWATLINFVGGSKIAGTKLKAPDSWAENGYGTDDYGFSASWRLV